MKSAQQWSADSTWKDEFFSIENVSPQELARRRAEFDQIKAVGKEIREQTPNCNEEHLLPPLSGN